MLDQLVNSPTIDYLTRGMKAAELRHSTISNNIANVNTPHFKRSEVVFESMLAKELELDQEDKMSRDKKLKMARTRDNHLGEPNSPIRAIPTMVVDNSNTLRVDDNNVDIDSEMANLAKNQIYYNALTKKLGSHFQQIKTVLQTK